MRSPLSEATVLTANLGHEEVMVARVVPHDVATPRGDQCVVVVAVDRSRRAVGQQPRSVQNGARRPEPCVPAAAHGSSARAGEAAVLLHPAWPGRAAAARDGKRQEGPSRDHACTPRRPLSSADRSPAAAAALALQSPSGGSAAQRHVQLVASHSAALCLQLAAG